MKWIRENMNQINLVEEGKKIAYIAYINWEWKLFEGGAIGSFVKSAPSSFLNSCTNQSMITWSKSSPPNA